MFIYQQTDINNSDNTDIDNVDTLNTDFLTGTIKSFKDINIEDIASADYLFIDLDQTIIDCFEFPANCRNDYIKIDTFRGMYYYKHDRDCRLLKKIEINIDHNGMNFFYITEHDINDTIGNFKKAIPNLEVYALSRSWPGRMIKGRYYQTGKLVYSREDQLKNLGINVIDQYVWTNHIDKGVFLFGWDGSLNEYCKCCYNLNKIPVEKQIGYFDKHPELIGKKIVIIDNDINQLRCIYKEYEKYPEYIHQLKLYLYKNPFVAQIESGDALSTLDSIEKEYCDCKGGK